MNFVCFSPHFPSNFYPFAVELRKKGINVLGLADAAYNDMRPELRAALTEYYRVSSMENYDELVRALGYFTHRYGKLDRFESHNEYWLESDARLREDFNIPGLRPAVMGKMKRKSLMKAQFIQAGIAVARGRVANTLAEALELAEETGFPLVAKPDTGVGANKTYRIEDRAALEVFYAQKPPVDYILEEFIPGTIQTFDGLTDQDGRVVFCASMQYSYGIMETVNTNGDCLDWIQREIPPDLEAAGRRLAAVYGLRERFFHFEFFRTEKGLVGLEVNMRPPGGLTTDMWNYANDIDIYREYANVVAENQFAAQPSRSYYCLYVGRRNGKTYKLRSTEVETAFRGMVVHHEAVCGVFASAIGDDAFLLRSPDFDEARSVALTILETA